MTNWIPIFVLPNIEMTDSIGDDIVVLAPPNDTRVAKLKRDQPNFRKFLGRFSDTFGVKFQPAVLLVRESADETFFHVTPLASFRDLIAIAAITYCRSREVRNGVSRGPMFGEAFAIYPWSLSKDYDYLVGNTAGMRGLHPVSEFRGKSSPAIFRASIDSGDMDKPLLEELLRRWRRRYESSEPEWKDVALFRSLNMAFYASQLPAATDTTLNDIGRLVSLWVSAFEIIAHPGADGRTSIGKVFDLIESTSWVVKSSGDLFYETGGKKSMKRSAASWIYEQLYKCRNNFLHGNPVDKKDLELPISGRNMFRYSASLYRIALTGFLPLNYGLSDEHVSDLSQFDSLSEEMYFSDPQRLTEEAVLAAVRPREVV